MLTYLETAWHTSRTVVVFDRSGPSRRTTINPNYLAPRRRKKGSTQRAKNGGFPPPPRPPAPHPLHTTAHDHGCLVTYPQQGWDADDTLAALTSMLLAADVPTGEKQHTTAEKQHIAEKQHTPLQDTPQQHDIKGTPLKDRPMMYCNQGNTTTTTTTNNNTTMVVVASADSDMASVVTDDRVTWAQLALPTQPATPWGYTAWTRGVLKEYLGYEPALHGDYLALAGKAEAGLSGCGIGSRAAKTLLQRYGSIDALLTAAGTNKGFGKGMAPKIQQALVPSDPERNPSVATILSNRALTTLCTDIDQVIDQATRTAIMSFGLLNSPHTSSSPPPSSSPPSSSLPVVWLHPRNAVRREFMQGAVCDTVIQQLQARGCVVHACGTSPAGWPVDIVVTGYTLKKRYTQKKREEKQQHVMQQHGIHQHGIHQHGVQQHGTQQHGTQQAGALDRGQASSHVGGPFGTNTISGANTSSGVQTSTGVHTSSGVLKAAVLVITPVDIDAGKWKDVSSALPPMLLVAKTTVAHEDEEACRAVAHEEKVAEEEQEVAEEQVEACNNVWADAPYSGGTVPSCLNPGFRALVRALRKEGVPMVVLCKPW